MFAPRLDSLVRRAYTCLFIKIAQNESFTSKESERFYGFLLLYGNKLYFFFKKPVQILHIDEDLSP